MRLETRPGEVHRLVVKVGPRNVVYAARHFRRFEQAQARVADAVRSCARKGVVSTVTLQRGTPVPMSPTDTDHPTTLKGNRGIEYSWTIEKQWGLDVVRRILLNGNGSCTHAPARRAKALPGRPPIARTAIRHKPARWHLAATAEFVLLAIVTLLIVQTGGHPLALLASVRDPQPTVKRELPFNARTSFADTSGSGEKAATEPATQLPQTVRSND